VHLGDPGERCSLSAECFAHRSAVRCSPVRGAQLQRDTILFFNLNINLSLSLTFISISINRLNLNLNLIHTATACHALLSAWLTVQRVECGR
jgi:hypothetical protein